MGVKNTREIENGKKGEKPKKKKSCYVISRSEYAAELSKLSMPLDVTRKYSDSNLYLLKTRYTKESVYEFPTKEQEVKEILHFVSNRNERRNAMCEESPKKIYNFLNAHVRDKYIMDFLVLSV